MVVPWKEKDLLGDPQKLPDRFLSVDRYNKIRWESQAALEIFNVALYAEGEKAPSWDLPGKGRAYIDCGSVLAKGCDNIAAHPGGKVKRRLYKRNCRRKSCPVDYQGWAAAQAERALIRLASYCVGKHLVRSVISEFKKKFERHPKRIFHEALVIKLESMIKKVAKDRSIPFLVRRRLRAFHVVLSPSQDRRWDSAEAFKSDRTTANEVGKAHGLDGGALIPHPYRLRCAKCKGIIPDHHKKCPTCGGSEFEWFFSPHYHAVGFGWIQNSAQGYQEHGWIVRNLKDRKSIFYTFQYLLSHAGVSQFHTVTWFGDLAYRSKRMGRVPVLGSMRELCPECGFPLRPMKWCGLDRPPPELEYQKGDPYKNDSWEDSSDWRCF